MLGDGVLVLEEVYKSKKIENSEQFNLRIHRGLSWLKKAIQLDDDLDLQFISLWVGFNAVYAQDMAFTQDRQSFRQFLHKVCQLDQGRKIYNLIWEKFSSSIRLLIENPYVFQSFWDFQNQKISQKAWKEDFDIEKKRVHQALQSKDTVDLLFVIFNRLYTLRNQLMHGGATYKSSLNRKQLQDACHILVALLPAFIHILLEHSKDLDLGKPFYPVVQVS